ncbi:MAG: hypothetical protein EOP50_11885 [Sphingobacteriales bacterium]|nr:MAG: hypothetical protein EOP50_11885 [Sphingobacteriales bacterium]
MRDRKELKYEFTAIETYDMSLELANELKNIESLEAEAKSVKKQYDAKIDSAKTNVRRLSELVAAGFEIRTTPIEILYHRPEPGLKTTIRKDNGHETVEQMDYTEKQRYGQTILFPEENLAL